LKETRKTKRNQYEPEGTRRKEPEGRSKKEGTRKKLEKLFSLNIKIKQANLEKEIPVGGVQVLVRAEINKNNNLNNTSLGCR
jgi:hypothetical protein